MAGIVNVLTTIVVTFLLLYFLNNPYSALEFKVGFIFGSVAVCFMLKFRVFLCTLVYKESFAPPSRINQAFLPLSFHTLVLTFFCGPDWNGKSLEEIEFISTEGSLSKKFGRYKVQEKFKNSIKKETGGMGGISETSMVEE